MLRLNASLLESTRLYQAGVIDSDNLIDSIAGVTVETPQMALGSAFHAVFEDPLVHLDYLDGAGVYHHGDFTFDAELVDKVLGDIWDLEPVVEAKTEDLVVQTDHGPARIVCQADALAGLDCWELKTSEKSMVPERYMGSMQWRAYALAFGANQVTYRLVQLKRLKDCDVWTIQDAQSITVFPYPRMAQDVAETANDLARFISINGLEDYRLEKEAA